MKLSTATTSGDSGQSFTERHGGWILSVCFHVILFAFLVIARQKVPTLPIQRSFDTIRVSLAGPESAATAVAATLAPEPVAPIPAEVEPVISMRNAPVLGPAPKPGPDALATEEALAAEKAAAEDVSLAAALRPMAAVEIKPVTIKPMGEGSGEGGGEADKMSGLPAGGSTETGPGAPDGQYAPGARSKRGEGIAGDGTGPGTAGWGEVGGRIHAAQAGLAAQKAFAPPGGLFAARGASAGAIRSIDLNGVDGERAKEVLGRYGITIMIVPAGTSGRDTLTGGGLGQGQFVTRIGTGGLGIFRFSSVAANRMGQLEDAALRAHGDDPAKTRLVRVTFGIISTATGTYDLGVMDMKTEPLMTPRERIVEKRGE